MADLLLRPSGLDAALMSRVCQAAAGRPVESLTVRPRLVLNPVLAIRQPRFADVARQAGVPVMVDPMTPYWQDYQHVGDPWAALPFGQQAILTVADLRHARQAELAEAVLAHQIQAQATRLITPYVHIARADDGWLDRQVSLYAAARAVLDEHHVRLPVTAVIDIGWRLLDRTTWAAVLTRLLAAIAAAGYDEIALAASNVDAGVQPYERLAALLATVAQCSTVAPVIAWNQGTLGEACIAGGATGYETGIGWRERCHTMQWMGDRRTGPPPREDDRGRTPRPIYIAKLGRSIPRRTVEAALPHRSVSPDLVCEAASGCCAGGTATLLADSRWHAVHARVRTLRALVETGRPFRWTALQAHAEGGLELAARLNAIAERAGVHKVRTDALTAIRNCPATAIRSGRTHAA